ncbi:MAG: ABC transporter permease [Thermoleophilaceae bacterium]|nr:ABC transporter permease [Thermoleophilaceae bacterium]
MTGVLRLEARTTWALMRRGLNEILRVPGAAIPGMLAPTIFGLGLTSVFGNLTSVPGFGTDDYFAFLLPVGYLQAAGFTGAATGVNLARDIEQGWFDRLLASPAPRRAILLGLLLSASLRVLLPISILTITALILGVNFPAFPAAVFAVALACAFAAVAAAYAASLALKFKTQSAAPLMQATVFMLVLFAPAYAPQELLQDWLRTISEYNPLTPVLEAIRQGFVEDDVTWSKTWPALLSLLGMGAFTIWLATRNLERMNR